QDVQVGEAAPQRLGAGRLGGPRRRLGAGEREDGVAIAEELGDDGGPDQAGAASYEDAHGTPRSDGTLYRHSSIVMGQGLIMGMGSWAGASEHARRRWSAWTGRGAKYHG